MTNEADSNHPLDDEQDIPPRVNSGSLRSLRGAIFGTVHEDGEQFPGLQPHDYANTELSMRTIRSALFVFVFTLVVLGNVLIPSGFRYSNAVEILVLYLIGVLLAQPALLACWCAVGPQSFPIRFLATFALNLTCCSAYVLGLQGLDAPNSQMPLGAAISIFAISTVSFMVAALSLKGICWSSGERLVDWIASKPICNRDQQKYSIAQLITLTTLVALGIVGIRAILPAAAGDVAPLPTVWPTVVCIVIAVHAISCVLLLTCAAKMTLSEPTEKATILKYSLFVALVLALEIFVLTQVRLLSFDLQSVVRTVAFNAGFFSTVLGALGMLRSVGYRLVKVR